MDPPTIVKTVKYNSLSSSQQAMFVVSQNPPLHYKSFPQYNHSAFADAPHHHLQKTLENNQVNCSAGDDTEISIFDAQRYFSDCPKVVQKLRHLDHPSPDIPSAVSSADGYSVGQHFRTRSFHATPTASSEASWNSQTGLLANPPGSAGVSMANFSCDDRKSRRNARAAKKWIFGRKCCCTGKESVQVKEATLESDNSGPENSNNNGKSNHRRDYSHKAAKGVDGNSSIVSETSSVLTADILEDIHQVKIRAPNPIRLSPENSFPDADAPRQQRVSASGGGFSFPILNPNSQSKNPARIKLGIITKSSMNDPSEDPPRYSLEVFQPMNELPPINPRQQFNPESPIAREDDMCSDASSDLFEIESFSTQTAPYPMYRMRDSLDEATTTFNARRFAAANGLKLDNDGGSNNQFGRRSLDEPPTPSVAATECYAPSEVSIDWSVTTAEGFDKASVSNFSVSASEIGSTAMFRHRMQEESCCDGGKKKGIGGGGLLLMSCRQEKAVSVGPQPVKCTAADGKQKFPSRPPRGNKPPLGNSQSARLSLAFAA